MESDPIDLSDTLVTLFSELIDGASPSGAYMLNWGDAGLLRSLDNLSAGDASATATGGASIAAHVDHVRYGLSLLNRWTLGESPWRDADWAASWRLTSVSDAEWERLRADLAREARQWRETIRSPREVSGTDLNVIIGEIAHVAYHLGAIRQIDRAARGPSVEEEAIAKRRASG